MDTLAKNHKVKLSDYGYSILQIETMRACDMKCKFCVYPLIPNKGDKLSSEEVYAVIDCLDSNDSGFDYICFNQFNEPLLDSRTFEFIRYAKAKGFKVLLPTNGLSLRSKEIREQLIKAGPTFIKLSLHTVSETIYLSSRGIDCPFDEYKKGIFEFLQLSFLDGFSTRITIDVACNFLNRKSRAMRTLFGLERGDPSIPDRIQELEQDLILLVKELHDFEPRFDFNEERIHKYLKEIDKNYREQDELPLSKNVAIKIKPFVYGRRLVEFHPAFPLGDDGCRTGILSVLSDATVVPCCLAYDERLSLGSIREESIEEILAKNKSFLEAIKRGENLPEVCRKCKGAPTKRGALAISIYRYIRDRTRLKAS